MTGPTNKNGNSQGPEYRPVYIAKPDALGITQEDFSNTQELQKKLLFNLKLRVKAEDNILEYVAKTVCEHYAAASESRENPNRKQFFVGPSSVGKAYSVFQAASILHIPVAIVQCDRLDSVDSVASQLEEAASIMLADAKSKYVSFWMGADVAKYRAAREAVYRHNALKQEKNPAVHSFGNALINAIDRVIQRQSPGGLPSEQEIAALRAIAQEADDCSIEFAKQLGIIILDDLDKIVQNNDPQRSAAVLEALNSAEINISTDDECTGERKNVTLPSSGLRVITGEFASQEGEQPAAVNAEQIINYGILPSYLENAKILAFGELSQQAFYDLTRSQLDQMFKMLNSKTVPQGFERIAGTYFSPDSIEFSAGLVDRLGIGAKGAAKFRKDLLEALLREQNAFSSARKEITPEVITKLLSGNEEYTPILGAQ
jgi:hypothetical protein